MTKTSLVFTRPHEQVQARWRSRHWRQDTLYPEDTSINVLLEYKGMSRFNSAQELGNLSCDGRMLTDIKHFQVDARPQIGPSNLKKE